MNEHPTTEMINRIVRSSIALALIKAGVLKPGECQFGISLPTPDEKMFVRDRDVAREELDRYFRELDERLGR